MIVQQSDEETAGSWERKPTTATLALHNQLRFPFKFWVVVLTPSTTVRV